MSEARSEARKDSQRDTDPLPYTQVDRAAKAKASLLATRLGVTPQHALGSLVEWWDLHSDPRTLEAIVKATPRGQKPAVFDSSDEAKRRWRLASGHDLEPIELVDLGLLEARGAGQWRVRGMSRQFEPIMRRLTKRSAGSVGGKASAEVRKRNSGTAKPLAAASESASESASGLLRGCFGAAGSTPEARPSAAVSGQRSAVKGHRSATASLATPEKAPEPVQQDLPAMPPAPPPEPRALSWQEDLMIELEGARAEACDAAGVEFEIEPQPSPGFVNLTVAKLLEGFNDPRERAFVWGDMVTWWTEQSFGLVDKDGKQRSPPWPLRLFAHPNIAKQAREYAIRKRSEHDVGAA